jgi:hypothetical protein
LIKVVGDYPTQVEEKSTCDRDGTGGRLDHFGTLSMLVSSIEFYLIYNSSFGYLVYKYQCICTRQLRYNVHKGNPKCAFAPLQKFACLILVYYV